MAVGSISSDIWIEKGDLCYCLQCPTYFEWEKYHPVYELMDYFLFRLKSYNDDDCGPDDAIPSFRRNFCLAYCNFMM